MQMKCYYTERVRQNFKKMVKKWFSSKTTYKDLTEEPIIKQADKRKEKKKKLHRKHTSFNWLGKKLSEI